MVSGVRATSPPALLCSADFGAEFEELSPTYTRRARSIATRLSQSYPPPSKSDAGVILARFHPLRGGPPLGPIRLALLWQGRWLYVGSNGVARLTEPHQPFEVLHYGKERGTALHGSFDVVGFEKVLRDRPPSGVLRPSTSLVGVELSNRTSLALVLANGSGRVEARVLPGTTVHMTTWLVGHELYGSGRRAAVIDPFFGSAVSVSRHPKLRVEIRVLGRHANLYPLASRLRRDWLVHIDALGR